MKLALIHQLLERLHCHHFLFLLVLRGWSFFILLGIVHVSGAHLRFYALSGVILGVLDRLLSRLSPIFAVFLWHFADLLIVELFHVVHLRLVLFSQLQDGLVHVANLVLQIFGWVLILWLSGIFDHQVFIIGIFNGVMVALYDIRNVGLCRCHLTEASIWWVVVLVDDALYSMQFVLNSVECIEVTELLIIMWTLSVVCLPHLQIVGLLIFGIRDMSADWLIVWWRWSSLLWLLHWFRRRILNSIMVLVLIMAQFWGVLDPLRQRDWFLERFHLAWELLFKINCLVVDLVAISSICFSCL